MKFSIITPEHNPKNVFFLLELFESIKDQTYTKWEWILYLNGECTIEHVPDEIRNHNQVVIHIQEEDNKNVGYVKNKAFNLATGDILVEVDHDDMITPDCLQELYNAFQDEEIGFV